MDEFGEFGTIKVEKNRAVIKINPQIYSLDIVQKAAYILMDKATIFLEGNPLKEIKAEIRLKREEDKIEEIITNFNEELLNYAVYKDQSEQNKVLKQLILQRVLLTNDPAYKQIMSKNSEEKDPEGILKKWEDSNKK